MTFDLEPRPPVNEPRTGPQVCCSDFGFVTDCADGLDFWKCSLCDRRWSAICRPDDAEVKEEGGR